ncbi:MAG: hypothetical protein Q9204_006562 [Flavoplaca sp. TL-2023a]
MKDVYEPHPTKPDLWRFVGRSDDIIVFSNGEKFQPLVMEGMITDHPAVKAALVTGQGRFQTALLLEPADVSIASPGAFIDEVWPTIQKANRQCATQGSIAKDFILVTSPEKPMLRASKGTVQRKSTLRLYEREFETLYTDTSPAVKAHAFELNFSDHAQLTATLRTLISDSLNQELVDVYQDLFQIGLDSLQVLTLTKGINGLLRAHGKSITTATIFASVNIATLAKALGNLGHDNDHSSGRLSDSSEQNKEMDELLERYTPHLHRRPTTNIRVVLLTGSTGSLGSYLLHNLIVDPTVNKIYCLNRSPKSSQRQEGSQNLKGLSTDFQKVRFLQWDPLQHNFGLDQRTEYQPLLEEVTDILHNAWEVNFNLSLQSFKSHLSGVQSLIEFSHTSARRAHIFFISTIGTVMDYGNDQFLVPEALMENWSSADGSGYSQSKLIAERILANASKTYNVPVTICRVGQIAGPTKKEGMWPKQEWLPSLIISAKYLGSIPESLGPVDMVDWVPIDLVANIVGELLSSSKQQYKPLLNGAHVSEDIKQGTAEANIFHIVNPRRSTWQDLLPSIIGHHGKIQSTDYTTWLTALRKSLDDDAGDVNRNPAVKLLSFFENIETKMESGKRGVTLDTKGTEAKSETMRDLTPVGGSWMENWLKQWGS